MTATDETGRKKPSETGRERISGAAYELFVQQGVRDVGVDTIIAKAGAAKMTFYRNFPSKEDLILDFLRRREEIWTEQWLISESRRRARSPQNQLLAIFDLFDEWFAQPDFKGCVFLTTMLEVNDQSNPVHIASVGHLARIHNHLEELARDAGVRDPVHFARQWHILMKGSIMSAIEGHLDAARSARELGELLLRSQGISLGSDQE